MDNCNLGLSCDGYLHCCSYSNIWHMVLGCLVLVRFEFKKSFVLCGRFACVTTRTRLVHVHVLDVVRNTSLDLCTFGLSAAPPSSSM